MDNTSQRWERLYSQTALCDVPYHFANLNNSPFMLGYLTKVLRLCPSGGRTLETGVGAGTGAIWLSLRGCQAEGLDFAPGVVERARQINTLLSGHAAFRVGDLFHLYQDTTGTDPASPASITSSSTSAPSSSRPYSVIHHQGVLEHFSVPYLQAALAQQTVLADWVVFSVPSVYYPFEPEFGDERLMPLEEWERLLAPFDIAELTLYGDPQHGEREHVLCVLRGQEQTADLLARMTVPADPYPPGISAIVHTRNESRHLADCLTTLQSWTDEIIVCDMESEDDTVEIARKFTDNIVHHPRISNFDRARNVSAMRARFAWVFYLDADERVPAGLGQALRRMVVDPEQAPEFAAVLPPFRHHFAGHWLRCLYPGYTAPRLLQNGKFAFNARLHTGAQAQGPSVLFPGDNPDLALVHHSYDSLAHYLDKLNRYTDAEAVNMHRDGQPFHWEQAIRHFVQDFQDYYDRRQAGAMDGVHGFIYSFLSAFYRFEQHAKLYELRFREGSLRPDEQTTPASVEAMLEYALDVLRAKPKLQATALTIVPRTLSPAASDAATAIASGAASVPSAETAGAAHVVWSGPLLDPSGYGEESRHLLGALEAAGIPAAAQILPWNLDAPLSEAERAHIAALTQLPVRAGFTQVIQTFPTLWERHPDAGVVIGRTMFETDRLPQTWVDACNRLDAIWVPSEFNRRTFAFAGVQADKLAVVPGCFDPAPYALTAPMTPLAAELQALRSQGTTVFLAVFDWTRHKGWDALLLAFLAAFAEQKEVCLVLKVWSTLGYSAEAIQLQAQETIRAKTGADILADGRIRWVFDRLPHEELIALYQASSAFALPSRGEGWGRPYMEAMACGLPTIGTDWSGNTAFMTADCSYLLEYALTDIPEEGWREVPAYQGHRWADPSVPDLVRTLQNIRENSDEALARGKRGQARVAVLCSRHAVGEIMREALARLQEKLSSPSFSQSSSESSSSVAAPLLPLPPADAMPETVAAAAHAPETTRDRRSGRGKVAPPASTASHTPPAAAIAPRPATAPVLRWEGDFFQWHSLALVNRELCLHLQHKGAEIALVPSGHTHFLPDSQSLFAPLVPRAFAPLSRPADAHIRHFFPPRLQRPDEGAFVLMQPWEYGYLPTQWIEPIRQNVDEVWCYSRYVKDVYLASGIAEQKLQVVPLGVDSLVFTPSAPPYIFTNEAGAGLWRQQHPGQSLSNRARANADRAEESKETPTRDDDTPFVFLFVGGTLQRKGIDILLDAYLRAFSAYDDVCLVIKDTGTQTVYRGQNEQARLLALAEDSTRPRIVYLDQDMSAHRLAGLYTACDCLVQPYRGEGFCLPALEALACGLPVLVPAGGPTDDFVDESVGWRLPAERKPFGTGRIGPFDCVGPIWQFEVAPDTLARQMRQVVNQRDEVRRRGAAGRERAQQWTWERSADMIAARLQALREQTSKPQSPKAQVIKQPTSKVPTSKRRAVESTQAVPSPVAANKPDTPVLRRVPTISLCMIVRDEERVLGDCLASVKPYVDEIIVVDTGSTDRTVEIAREQGVKIHFFPWCDDFSAARNVSLSHATGDWLLWMDADDTILPECGKRLRDLVMLAEDKVTGFLMQVHIPPAPGENGFTHVDHVKLFRNLPGMRFEGRIHEQILAPLYRLGGTIARTDLHVLHSGYDYSPEGQVKKRTRDLTILALELAERPDYPFVHHNIGMTYHHLKDFDKAIAALERYLELADSHESTGRKVYALLASSHLAKKELDKAKQRLEEGLRLYPADPELLFRAGVIYQEIGNLPAAEHCLLQLISGSETGHIDSLDVSMRGYKAHHNLAVIYQMQERYPEAEAQWRAALADNATFTPSWLGLAELFLLTRRFEDARQVASHIAGWDVTSSQSLLARLAGA